MADANIGNGWIILIVDDHPDNIVVARTVLEYYGAEVHVANNGADGLKLLDNITPTVILLDLSMPVMNGWDMLKELRQRPDTADTAIIAVTAHAMQDDRNRVFEAGFDDYVPKPYDVHMLVDRIQDVVQKKGVN